MNTKVHEYPYYGCLNPLNDALPDGLSVHEYPYYGYLNKPHHFK